MKLTKKEQFMSVGLAVFVGLWAFYLLGIKPAVERIGTLKRVIPEKKQNLERLKKKSYRYIALRAELDGFKRLALLGEKDFEPLEYLESMTGSLRLDKKIASMRKDVLRLDADYNEVIIEIKLQRVSIKELIDLLMAVRSSNLALYTRSLYVRKDTSNPQALDALVQISALKPDKSL